MTKKNNAEPLRNLFEKYLKATGNQENYYVAKIVNNWEEIMGKAVANNTKEIFVENRKLYIKISSPVLNHELNFIKDKICTRINNFLEKNFVDNIVIY